MTTHAGGSFTLGQVTVLPEKAGPAPTLASWNGLLYLAWTGTDLHINLLSSPEGGQSGGKQRLEHRSYTTDTRSPRSPLTPVLARSPGGLHLAWTDGDRRPNVLDLSRGPAGSPGGHLVLPERTAGAPWITAGPRSSILSWAGRGNHLHVSHVRDGAASSPVRLPAKTWFHHAVCAIGDRVLVAWKANAWRGKGPLKFAYLEGDTLSDPYALKAESRQGPSMAAAGDTAVVTWPGRKGQIMAVAFSPTDGPGPVVPLPVFPFLGDRAVVTAHNEELVIAWADQRRNLCVAPLHLG